MSSKLPSLTPQQVYRALTQKRAGFYLHRASKGSHRILAHPDDPTIRVVIAWHTKALKAGTLASIIKQTKLTREEFLELL